MSQSYVIHSGIKNQKWGVKNGPPYPLDKKTHNKVVSGDNPKSGSELDRAGEKVKKIEKIGSGLGVVGRTTSGLVTIGQAAFNVVIPVVGTLGVGTAVVGGLITIGSEVYKMINR